MIRTHIETALGHTVSDAAFGLAVSFGNLYLKKRYKEGIRVTSKRLLSVMEGYARIADKAYPVKENAA